MWGADYGEEYYEDYDAQGEGYGQEWGSEAGQPGALSTFSEHVLGGEGVVCLDFDATQEVLWVGLDAGTICSLVCPSLTPYAWWRAHRNAVLAIAPAAGQCLSVSQEMFRLSTIGGVARLSFRRSEEDLTACAIDHTTLAAYIGHTHASGSPGFTRADLASGIISDPVPPGDITAAAGYGGVTCMATSPTSNALFVGLESGHVLWIDPRRGMAPVHVTQAHRGPVTSVAVHRGVVATTGVVVGNDGRSRGADRHAKVFDVRRATGMTESTPVMMPMGVAHIAPHPLLSTTMLATSAVGLALLLDVHGHASTPIQVNIATTGGELTCGAIGSAGDVVAFGDSVGGVRLLSASETPRVNVHPVMPEPASAPRLVPGRGEPIRLLDPVDVDPTDYCMTSATGQEEGMYLSDLPPTLTMSVGKPPRVVPPAIAQGLRPAPALGTGVSAAPNPHYVRGQTRGEAARAAHPLLNARAGASEQSPAASRRRSGRMSGSSASERRRSGAEAGELAARIPPHFRHVLARLPSSAAPFAEFDFLKYNKTRFAGLENDAPNTYCNALLQALINTPAFVAQLLRHAPDPDNEFSLTCELSLLVRMVRDSTAGAPCQAANFLRALGQSKEAVGLGLLEAADAGVTNLTANKTNVEREASKDKNLLRRSQTLSRFVLEQVHNEGTLAGGGVKRVFGVPWVERLQCLRDQSQERVKRTVSFQIDLIYPPQERGQGGPGPAAKPRAQFSDVLRHSLMREATMRAWFNDELKYQPVRQTRTPTSLPEVLVIGTSLHQEKCLHFWEDVVTNGDDVDGEKKPWLPPIIDIDLEAPGRPLAVRQAETWDGLLAAREAAKAAATGDAPGSRAYILTAVVSRVGASSVVDGNDDAGGHLVSHVRLHRMHLDAVGANGAEGAPPPSPAPPTPGLSPLPTGWRPSWGAGTAASPPPGAAGSKATQVGDSPAVGQTAAAQGAEQEVSPREGDWLLLNDFLVCPSHEAEARAFIPGGVKTPSLVFYSRVEEPEVERQPGNPVSPVSVVAAKDSIQPVPVLTPQGYAKLARDPPLNLGSDKLFPYKFEPLDMSTEAPRPGMLVAVDAEFVEFAPAERTFKGGQEVVLRPPRLGLARVSVIRGEPGPLRAKAFQDDHVRSPEPVWDHLTRWSGVQPGDLSPETSPHYLTTLRKAYVKLRYLVDAGCVFIGHGLRKDFRMLNLVVKPSQVIDTVDLFHFKRQRKLSLRFLTGFLLGLDIQREVHDSIEDARSALLLYDKYKELVAEGTLEETLLEMYRWGKVHGWGPVAWQDGVRVPTEAGGKP
ncbi:unnamed protein product [Pedinophyceae sp. YPF-701]|nr:unnamed protein product [Pedinophyceae sp. YPF-701]